MQKLHKKAILKIVGLSVLLIAIIAIGILLGNRLVQPNENFMQLGHTNWFMAIPFMLMLGSLVVIGYMIDRVVEKGKTDRHDNN